LVLQVTNVVLNDLDAPGTVLPLMLLPMATGPSFVPGFVGPLIG
jgi:hypothetical protein